MLRDIALGDLHALGAYLLVDAIFEGDLEEKVELRTTQVLVPQGFIHEEGDLAEHTYESVPGEQFWIAGPGLEESLWIFSHINSIVLNC